MKKLGNYKEILICLLFIALACFFPLTGRDMFWANRTVSGIKEFIDISNGSFLPTIFTLSLSKTYILRIFSYGILFSFLILIMQHIVGKKNGVLSCLGLFILLLIDKVLFAASIVNLSGMTTSVLSSIVMLLFYNLFTKDEIYRKNPFVLFTLGFLGTITTPLVTILILIVTFYYLYKDRIRKDKKKVFLLVGEIIGSLLIFLTTHLEITDFINNLFYSLMPILKGSNFLITLILSLLLLFEGLKIWRKKNKIYSSMSILGILFFLSVFLIPCGPIVYYLGLIINLLSCYYILMTFTKSKIFRNRMHYWFLFKVGYIILLLIFGNIEVSSTFFLVILDILLILEIYGYVLPKDYLNIVWTVGSIVLLLANIYIYKSVSTKYMNMNEEIKNKLENEIYEIAVPKRYKTDYLYDVLPKNKEELAEYIEYFQIDIDTEKFIQIRFKED